MKWAKSVTEKNNELIITFFNKFNLALYLKKLNLILLEINIQLYELMFQNGWYVLEKADTNKITINLVGGDKEASSILRDLVLKDIPVISYSKSAGNLEEVFIQITEEDS